MKLGSLFDGSGGFPLAAKNVGITPIWASEVNPYCVAVTRQNLPEVEHLGDVSKISGAKIEPVDIITFGSPCQDMSVAGKREGLHGERSGLFFEATRIVKEMREATNGRYPRFAIWENVLGSLTSNGGNDFGCVINELLAVVGVDPVVRPSGKWRKAGAVCGDAFSLAWRVFNAQFWGVPQRRRRVFLVCDFRGQSAPEILFKAENVRVLSQESGEDGNGHASAVETSAHSASGRRVFCVAGNSKRPSTNGKGWLDDDLCYTLNTVERHAVAVFENHGNAGRYRQVDGACQTLTEQLGTGGNNAPLVITANPRSIDLKNEVNVVTTLTTKYGQDVPFVVAVSPSNMDCRCDVNVAPTILACVGFGGASFVCAENNNVVRFLTPSECAKLQGFPPNWGKVKAIAEDQLPFWRKLFDQFDAINGVKRKSDKQILKWMRNPYCESSEYKMWGNGVALPCVQHILGNVANLDESRE